MVASLVLAAGAGAAPRAAEGGYTMCTITSSTAWKSIDGKIGAASAAVSGALGGGSVKDGVAGAKLVADTLRSESKLIAGASGDAKSRKALSEVYAKTADVYDRIAKALPDLSTAMTKMRKGDLKAIEQVGKLTTTVIGPASTALQKLTDSWSSLVKGC